MNKNEINQVAKIMQDHIDFMSQSDKKLTKLMETFENFHHNAIDDKNSTLMKIFNLNEIKNVFCEGRYKLKDYLKLIKKFPVFFDEKDVTEIEDLIDIDSNGAYEAECRIEELKYKHNID